MNSIEHRWIHENISYGLWCVMDTKYHTPYFSFLLFIKDIFDNHKNVAGRLYWCWFCLFLSLFISISCVLFPPQSLNFTAASVKIDFDTFLRRDKRTKLLNNRMFEYIPQLARTHSFRLCFYFYSGTQYYLIMYFWKLKSCNWMRSKLTWMSACFSIWYIHTGIVVSFKLNRL